MFVKNSRRLPWLVWVNVPHQWLEPVVGTSSHNRKVEGSIPGQGTYLGYRFIPVWVWKCVLLGPLMDPCSGCVPRLSINASLASMSLSSSFLSSRSLKKQTKMSLGEDLKKKES